MLGLGLNLELQGELVKECTDLRTFSKKSIGHFEGVQLILLQKNLVGLSSAVARKNSFT